MQDSNALVESNLSLVGRVLELHLRRQRGWSRQDREDMFQAGCQGLCQAAAHFKPKRIGKWNERWSAMERR